MKFKLIINKEKDEDDPSMVEIVYLPSWFESFAAA